MRQTDVSFDALSDIHDIHMTLMPNERCGNKVMKSGEGRQ